jgi:NAD(P)-dependent dehydrogenase (short-subunit alcohol dehydrogenase family)
MADQDTMQDPTTQYPQPKFDKQTQPEPGLAKNMRPKPDHGEDSYVGSGRLKGRRALVTGGDSGIGRAAAIAFAREGADVVINYLPEEEPDAKEVVALIKKAGRKVVALPGDISSEEFCKQLVEQAVEQLGGLDIVANVAGKQVSVEAIADVSTEQFDKTFKTNVYALFWICKYASTKGAITAFTKALAKQVAEKGIRVNAIAPGPVWTPLQPSHGQPEDALPDFGKQTPMQRPGQPAEVAPAYVFLASQESSFITAEVIGVTGGQHLP